MTVGITGGIGSGKSTVCRLFEERGVRVYYSDAAAKGLMAPGGPLAGELVRRFGSGVYRRGRELDRKYLAGIVFDDSQALADLNALVHPAVLDDFRRWTRLHAGEEYVILESAILFESGFDAFVDRTLAVLASAEERIARVCARDGCDAEAVRQRIAAQSDDDTLQQRADLFIRNDSSSADLAAEVDRLDRQFRREAHNSLP
ncbi:MAG: dephospho-CoA kinase [Alistipes sp.]|nr:dephospho-CoA kinase [Alistipes senegalensis]MCM1250099.1 dephospho-CoA kinase [Alistipes sp.]